MDGTVHRVEGSEARAEQGSGEAKAQGSNGRERRFGGAMVRLRGGMKASKRTKPVTSRRGRGAHGPEHRGARRRGDTPAEETMLAAPAGSWPPRLARGVGVSETRGERPWAERPRLTPGDPTAGKQAVPRGMRDPDEEQGFEGQNPRDGCGTKQGRGARVCHETAEGLRKPESGTATETDEPSRTGLIRGMPSRGGEPRGSRSGPGGSDGREDVTTLEGIDCKRT